MQNKYTLYIGLNDRDSLISYDIIYSIRMINSLLNNYHYTYYIANGYSFNEEKTLIYILYNIEEDVLNNIIDKILIMLNQESILLEKSVVYCSFIKNKL